MRGNIFLNTFNLKMNCFVISNSSIYYCVYFQYTAKSKLNVNLIGCYSRPSSVPLLIKKISFGFIRTLKSEYLDKYHNY